MGGPFVPWVPLREPVSQTGFGAVAGELAGLRLAVKDLFDVAGLPTGAGNPRWLETHPIPTEDAPAVARLLRAGASLVGKTITDELAWSLNGTNIHYGTPYNPAAPGRMPGGSSSGSAAAVAAALADIGLGTDTGGSIRVPASYCGLYGLRPTHARVPREGVVALAPTFDTAGLLCRDAVTLRKSAAVLLDPPDEDRPERQPRLTRLLVPRDIWGQVPEATAAALRPAVDRLDLPVDDTPLFDDPDGLDAARAAYTTLQGWEAWQTHGAWIDTEFPPFGPGVTERFANAAKITEEQRDQAQHRRDRVTALLSERLGEDAGLALPAAPGPAPLLDEQPDRHGIVRLTCLAGLAGAPAVALPWATVDDLPVGLQVVAAPGGDEALLHLANTR